MNSSIIRHFPVMGQNVKEKIIRFPKIMPVKVADCNFGLGGHSKIILTTLPNALIQAYDLDPQIIQYYHQHYAQELDEQQSKRLTVTQANFSSILDTKIFEKFNLVMADFGFCSFHLQTQRGFSWLKNQQLDMRYSQQGRTSASIVHSQITQVNQSSQLQLMSILKRYGDLDGSKAIAEAIIGARPLNTTQELREAIVKCFQRDKTRRIAQVFQAFRIATNNELKSIEKLCQSLQQCLQANGQFIGITFHSLELRIIHKFLQNNRKLFTNIKQEVPSKQQIKINPKSKSAKMISFKKIN